MKSSDLLKYSIIGSIIAIIVLVLWDLGTPDPIEEISINPLKVDWSFSNIDINSIIQTLLSAFLGFLLSILIIEVVINRNKEKEAKNKANIQLNNVMSVLKYPIRQYNEAAIYITNTHDYKNAQVNVPVSMDALCSIYKPQSSPRKPVWYKKIELYSDAVNELNQAITNIILNADLSGNKPLFDLLSNYLYKSSCLNSCSALLDFLNQKVTNPELKTTNLAEEIVKRLPELGLDFKPDNACYSFVLLKQLIEFHEEFFNELKVLK